MQLTVHEGPSVDALRGPEPVVLLTPDELAARARWPELSPRAAALGVTVALAVRMAWNSKTLGVLTLSSEDAKPLPDHTVALATAFAAHAATTVGYARKAEQLQLALETRQEVGQAMGILMERHGLDADSAFAYLRRLSQNGNVKLRDLANALRLTGRLPGDDSTEAPAAAGSEAAGAGRPLPAARSRDLP